MVYTVEADGDVVMESTVPQPIYEVVRPPELASWEPSALIVWYREWEHYLNKIRRRCAVTGERFEAVVSTVKGCVKPEVVKIIATYVLKRPAEVISDNDVLQLVHGRCNSLKNAYVPDVKSLFKKNLRMDLSIDDCDAIIFRYFQDFVKVVEDNGLQQLIGKTDPSLPGYRDRMKA
ncbi:hypothetical protein F441_00719, partial [Phytophthora nicotianae CJ01A1]